MILFGHVLCFLSCANSILHYPFFPVRLYVIVETNAHKNRYELAYQNQKANLGPDRKDHERKQGEPVAVQITQIVFKQFFK